MWIEGSDLLNQYVEIVVINSDKLFYAKNVLTQLRNWFIIILNVLKIRNKCRSDIEKWIIDKYQEWILLEIHNVTR